MAGVFQSIPVTIADWAAILPVLLCLGGAALLLVLRSARELQFVSALLVVVAVIVTDLALVLRVIESGPLAMTMGNWLPPFGISFAADIIGAVFALVAAVVTLLVLVYLRMDMPDRARQDGIYPLVLLLLGGVGGAFLTGDLFNLYVWFEVMLIASFGLMVLGGRSIQLDGTVKYGFLNFLATTLFLMALGLIYGLTGTLNMADLIGVAAEVQAAPLTAVAALLTLAFGMKAAAWPVNAWLPASYHTPPPAISALMAGLLTKVGVYALLRTLGMLLPESHELLQPVLVTVAAATLVLGPLGAIAETNLRRALGFLVIGGIGASVAGIALGGEAGLAGATIYAVHAMLTVTGLYMLAGLVESVTGETDTRRMGGLYAAAPGLTFAMLALLLAVAGVPPFLGFWPKLVLVEAGFAAWAHGGDIGGLVLWLGVLVNAFLTLVAAARLFGHVFWRAGPEGPGSEQPNPSLYPMDAPHRRLGFGAALATTAIVVALGLFPEPLMAFGRAAAANLLDPSGYIAATGLAGGG